MQKQDLQVALAGGEGPLDQLGRSYVARHGRNQELLHAAMVGAAADRPAEARPRGTELPPGPSLLTRMAARYVFSIFVLTSG